MTSWTSKPEIAWHRCILCGKYFWSWVGMRLNLCLGLSSCYYAVTLSISLWKHPHSGMMHVSVCSYTICVGQNLYINSCMCVMWAWVLIVYACTVICTYLSVWAMCMLQVHWCVCVHLHVGILMKSVGVCSYLSTEFSPAGVRNGDTMATACPDGPPPNHTTDWPILPP